MQAEFDANIAALRRELDSAKFDFDGALHAQHGRQLAGELLSIVSQETRSPAETQTA